MRQLFTRQLFTRQLSMRPLFQIILLLSLSFQFSGCGIDSTDEIAAIGDSVTWGYGGLPGGWVSRLERASGYKISNLAIPGETADDGAKRAKAAFLTVPRASKIIILHGGNNWVRTFRRSPCSSKCQPEDVADTYANVVMSQKLIRDIAHQMGKKTVFATYWASALAACDSFYDAEQFALYQKHLDYMNANTVKLAEALGDPIVRLDDIGDISKSATHYYDCLHPNETGYNIIAARWLRDIDVWKPSQQSHFAKRDLLSF